MAHQSATHRFTCASCGQPAVYEVTGYQDGRRLRWDGSVRCEGCPVEELSCRATMVSVDDYALLREQGGWFGLRIAVADRERVRLLKELRRALGLSLPEVARVQAMRTGPQFCGLEVEMRHVESLVLAAVPDAVTTVAQVDDESAAAQALPSRLWLTG